MKSYDLAKALNEFVKLLKASPNTDLKDIQLDNIKKPEPREGLHDPIAFSTFIAFSTRPKHEWVEIIERYNLPIKYEPRDGARNLMGKITQYYKDNPDARKHLIQTVEKEAPKASPELMKALASLLKS